ncbi:MAG: response regulator transcription factor [Flavobacteriales bacterium]|nr:response regulator transcription factor [Flavobacteriales bacterium]
MSLKIGILDDHPVVVEGVRSLLERNGFQVLWTAQDLRSALNNLRADTDLVLTDIQLPDGDGMQFCKEVKKRFPHVLLIGFSSFHDGSFVRNMFRNGASGYVLKESGEEVLLHVITEVVQGRNAIDPKISEYVITGGPGAETNRIVLTRREKEILQLLADGLSSKEIGDKLFLSVKTVEAHRTNMLLKLDASNVAHLIKIAYEKALI